MGIINILDSEISNKIAAGEVVERPASVVKELAENSIDAHAQSITIEIRNGGRDYIRVTDNGCGMSADDAKICFLRHATSKIKTDADLDAIYTLGFRGEALSSIGAVANVKISTKRAEDTCGVCVSCSGGEIVSSEDAGIPDGTDVVVENLFFNTPARQKFLKKDATEAGYITDIVTRLILAHPNISFRLIANGREKLFSPGDSSLLNAVYTVYGKDYARHMLDVEYENENVAVTGLVGVGTATRPNRGYQSFFVNGRYVKSPMMTRALEEAYKNQMMIGKYPVAVLNVKVDPALTDINVHPTKLEVKFSGEGDIYRAVFYAVSNALYREANVPKIEHKTDDVPSEGMVRLAENLPKNLAGQPYQSVIANGRHPKTGGYNPRENPFLNGSDNTHRADAQVVTPSAVDTGNTDNTVGADSQDRDTYAWMKNDKADDSDIFKAIQAFNLMNGRMMFFESAEHQGSILDEPGGEGDNTAAAEGDDEDKNVFTDEYFKIIGQVFETYIIAEKGDDMLIVDQHAAHERLKFEELKRDIENKTPFSQMLIEPVTVTVGAEELAAFSENKETFSSMGFECDEFGDDTIIVRAVPGEIEAGEVEDLLLDLLNEAKNLKREIMTDKQLRLLETIACKSAVKANMRLSMGEMEELLRNVLRMKNINTCPHGRPIIITMSKKELEKEFGRIV